MEKEEREIIKKIEEFFRVPARVADKVKNVAEKAKEGYILIETRPPWDGSVGPWTRLPVAKIVFRKYLKIVELYWMRASGRWWFYGKYKTFGGALRAIEKDKYGCFWG